jgi:4-aminobutyrate aminotransferase
MTDTDHAAELAERHRRVMPRWLSLFYDEPIELVSGSGRTVTDSEGRTYLDFFGGILTTLTGHSVPEVVDAIRTQAGRMLHSSTLYLIRPMVELAERIAGLSGIPGAKVFFVNSGSEANDTALLLCCTARRSNQVLALRHSYHGRSFATMAATGIRAWSSSSLSPFSVAYVHGGYRFRSPFGHLDDGAYIDACVEDLRDVIGTATSGDVACMIAEPIQGVAGFAVPPDGLLGAMGKVLDEYGILLVADEVQTGWGRTGRHFWGYEAHGVTPDIITFAKGLGNGLAIGGLAGRGDLIDSVTANSISTFGGNPLAAAGALANLEYLLSADLQANALSRGDQLLARLAGPAGRCRIVGELRGRGLMIAMELVVPGGREPNPLAASAVLESARRQGLLIGRGGLAGNVLRIAPPLSVTEEEVDRAAGILEGALEEAETSL